MYVCAFINTYMIYVLCSYVITGSQSNEITTALFQQQAHACDLTITLTIKTHGSESQGLEEAAYATYRDYYKHSTALKFVNVVTKSH